MDQAVAHLLARGVEMPNPGTVTIAPDVDLDRIAAGARIDPGCRISGPGTVISAGARLGAEGPVTIENCQLGENVALKGGYAADAVFLDGANLGLGHHVRGGTLLEEEAGGAHCVGLKQTILLPFVTLGSLINFCDCLMAGGTSRSDHSEVGSSYIHFNFTPDGDKATPSLFGDVPRGVMLRERPIFLGGQGGAVGPIGVAYGAVVGAGSVLRSDVVKEGSLVIVGPPPSMVQPYAAGDYRSINRVVGRNIEYLAQLRALQVWYDTARRPFLTRDPFGALVFDGAVELLRGAVAERVKRLTSMVAKVSPTDDARAALRTSIAAVCEQVTTLTPAAPDDAFVKPLRDLASRGLSYLDAVRCLDAQAVSAATGWLTGVVDAAWQLTHAQLPAVRRPVSLA